MRWTFCQLGYLSIDTLISSEMVPNHECIRSHNTPLLQHKTSVGYI